MSVVYCSKSRRQFLAGTGKTLLMLPLLPSLLTKEALAQTATANPRLMMFWFDHNNLYNMWPQTSVATTAVGANGAREVLLRNLGAANTLSRVFANSRYESLRQSDDLTILRGFDTSVQYGPGHGNFVLAAGQDRNSEGGHPTIDTLIEASPNVYPASTPSYVRRAIRISPGSGNLFYQRVGSQLQVLPGYQNNIRDFYNQVFSSLTTGGSSTPAPVDTTPQLKQNILNRAHAAFVSFRGNRRISSDDRARLDQHMGYLTDLNRSFNTTIPTTPTGGATCNRPTSPAASIEGDPNAYYAMYLSLLAVAFKCGLTRCATMMFEAHDPQWIPNLGIRDMHDAMHGSQGGTIQTQAYERWWGYFTNTIANNFVAPLMDMEGNTGRTYLSNMLTGLMCAGGLHDLGNDGGHSGLDSQQILLGSMGGKIRSGRYYALPRPGNAYHTLLPYNTFLITLLQLMGVPSSQYSAYAAGNQGVGYYGQFAPNHPLRSRFYQPITELLA